MIKLSNILSELKTRTRIKKSFIFNDSISDFVNVIKHLKKNYDVAYNVDVNETGYKATKPYNQYDAIIVDTDTSSLSSSLEGVVIYNSKLLSDDYLMSKMYPVPDGRWDYYMSKMFLSFFSKYLEELKAKTSTGDWRSVVESVKFLYHFDVERYPDMAAEQVYELFLDAGFKLPVGEPNGKRLLPLLLKIQKDLTIKKMPEGSLDIRIFKTMSDSQVFSKLYRSFSNPLSYRYKLYELKSTSGELKLLQTAIKKLWRNYVKEVAKQYDNDLSGLDRHQASQLEWNFMDQYVTDLVRLDKYFEEELMKFGYKGG